MLSPVSQPPAAAVLGRVGAPSSAKPATICRLHGSSANVEQVAMPYVFKYLVAELVCSSLNPTRVLSCPSHGLLTPFLQR